MEMLLRGVETHRLWHPETLDCLSQSDKKAAWCSQYLKKYLDSGPFFITAYEVMQQGALKGIILLQWVQAVANGFRMFNEALT